MADGGVKDAPYIARLFIPLIKKLEDMTDPFVSADIRLYYFCCDISNDTILITIFVTV